MKRIFILVILFLLIPLGVLAQPSSQTMSRIRDALDRTIMTRVGPLTLTLAANLNGVSTRSGTYWYTGALLRLWEGGQINVDNVAQVTWMPRTATFNHFFDITNTRWMRDSGDAANSDAIPNTQQGPFRLTLMHAWDAGGAVWQRVDSDVNGALIVNQTTANPGYGIVQDQNSVIGADVIGSFADDLAASLHGLMTGSVMYLDDGATLDMAKADATGGLVTGRNWTIAGEDAGEDNTGFNKVNTEPVTPPSETTAAIGTAAVTVFASREIIRDVNFCIYIDNTGANPLTDADINVSPDNTVWVDIAWAACDALASGSACEQCYSNQSWRYMRVRAAAADANQTDVEVWYTANKN